MQSRIEVVNFQSFNSYSAGVLGCTTYSFSSGSYLVEVPSLGRPGRPKEKDGAPVPEEYECHRRGRLHRSFAQPELERRDISDAGARTPPDAAGQQAVRADERHPG